MYTESPPLAGRASSERQLRPGPHTAYRSSGFKKAPCRSNGGIKIQLFFVVYPSALRFLNTDSVAMWYPPEDQPNRHDHHEDQCNYPFHFFVLCCSPVPFCSGPI